MESTGRYLDAIKARLNIQSDYALAAHWHVTRQNISDYRRGIKTLGDDRCIEVAGILGIPPEEVLIEIQADRARKQGNTGIAAIFERALKRLAHAPALVAMLAVFMSLATAPRESFAYDTRISGYANGLSVLRHNWYYVKFQAAVFLGLLLVARIFLP